MISVKCVGRSCYAICYVPLSIVSFRRSSEFTSSSFVKLLFRSLPVLRFLLSLLLLFRNHFSSKLNCTNVCTLETNKQSRQFHRIILPNVFTYTNFNGICSLFRFVLSFFSSSACLCLLFIF